MSYFSTKTILNYIPKYDTQRNIFLSKYPKYDGRGIKIAIIDSVIDVSLEGMQKTSEGLPKIIDCFDFTGAGHVDTSVIRKMNYKRILKGLSGRKLKIPKKWNNPSRNWHLGIKSLYKPLITSTADSPQSLHNNEIQKLPEMDCIVWFDGKKWLACIDTFGDLEDAKVLTNFRDEHEYGILSRHFNLSYCITVHNDGNLLEIYAPYCYHGSVVAQIAAAYFPFDSNGLAPGAQFISMNVSDPGKNNLMNPAALKKALLKCVEMKVNIINYSISQLVADKETEILINKLVEKHNILIFKGAGNDGPFYLTVDESDTSIQGLIYTIGALLTPLMKKRIYKIDDSEIDLLPVVSDTSSRGPASINRNLGIDFVAPGAAITNNPKFEMRKNKIFSGTSYSSPNAAGAVACLLSALKENSIQYSPSLIKFVLSKTACALETGNKLDFGHGVIQIDTAFEYCKNMIDFKLPKRLQELQEVGGILFTQRDQDHDVKEFVLDLPSLNHTVADKPEKWILQLSPLSAAKFIKISKIDDKNKQLSIKLDTSTLESGTLTFAEIQVQYPSYPSIPSLFNIPITAIVPLKMTAADNFNIQKNIVLNYDIPYHLFINPHIEFLNAKGIKKLNIKITAFQNVHAQLRIQYAIDNIRCNNSETIIEFFPDNLTQIYIIQVEKIAIYQICIDQYMNSPANVKYKLEFTFNAHNENN